MRRRFAPLIALVPVAFALIAASAAAGAAKFPEEFLWGTAIAGFQTEAGQGRNVDPASDWFAWTSRRTAAALTAAASAATYRRTGRGTGASTGAT